MICMYVPTVLWRWLPDRPCMIMEITITSTISAHFYAIAFGHFEQFAADQYSKMALKIDSDMTTDNCWNIWQVKIYTMEVKCLVWPHNSLIMVLGFSCYKQPLYTTCEELGCLSPLTSKAILGIWTGGFLTLTRILSLCMLLPLSTAECRARRFPETSEIPPKIAPGPVLAMPLHIWRIE